jgi:chromosome segregation ATPase
MPRYSCLLTAAALIFGCTYLEQKQDLITGGLAGREADANAKFQTARTQNQDLQDQQLQLDREIDRNNKRIASAQSDLDRVSAELNAARKRNAVSEADYRRLKSEVNETQSDLASVNMQLDAGRVTGNVDVAAKERQIQALEKKKSQLEKALGMSPRP